MDIMAETPVGQIAAEHPLATRVLARHRIDYCCGGGRTLGAACAAKGIAAETVIGEIERELASNTGPTERRWIEATPEELIAHIVAAYHEPLREELPRLEKMARKVAQVHGDRSPDTLPALASTMSALRADLERHMAEEEDVVFPRLVSEGDAETRQRLESLEHDHDEAGAALARIRELTGDFEVPTEACTTWRALWHGLADLERTMHEHVHLENNVLFPRATTR
jgi:regulator of cell morphogenesis and NO signaling